MRIGPFLPIVKEFPRAAPAPRNGAKEKIRKNRRAASALSKARPGASPGPSPHLSGRIPDRKSGATSVRFRFDAGMQNPAAPQGAFRASFQADFLASFRTTPTP